MGTAYVRVRPNMSGFRSETEAGVRGAFSGIGKIVTGALAGGAIVGAFKGIIGQAADFQSALNGLQAVSHATAAQMAEVSDKAKALGADMSLPATSAKDAADAMTELVKGGLSVQQSMAAAKGVLQLSAAAQISNADAATITARALNTFGLAGSQASHVADVLANAANKSAGDITDYAQALQQSGSVAKQFGLSIEDSAAALMEMAQNGVVGSDAGTSLKTMLQRLVPSGKQAAEAMKKLGVDVFDSHGKFVGIRGAIDQYQKALSGLTQEQRTQALQTIFGQDAIRAANIILGEGASAFDKYKAGASQAGSASALAAAKMKGLHGAIEGFKSVLQTVAIDVGTPFLGVLEGIVRKVADVTGAFDAAFNAPKTIAIGFGDVAAAPAGLGEKLKAGVTAAIQAVDWGTVGKTILDGITGALTAGAGVGVKLGALVRDSIRGVDWNDVGRTVGPGLAAAVASAFATLLDPGFWIRNWDLALAIGLAAFGGGLGKIGGKLAEMLGRAFEPAILAAAGVIERLSPRLAAAFVDGLLALPGLVGRAFGPLEGIVAATFGRLGRLSQFVLKVLGIDVAINAIADFARHISSTMASIAHAITGAFSTAFREVERVGLVAAEKVIEPFSHLPGGAGAWARRAKESIQNELQAIELSKFREKVDREFSAQIPKLAPLGHQTGQAWATGFGNTDFAIGGKLGRALRSGGDEASGTAAGVGSAVAAGIAAGISAGSPAISAAARSAVRSALADARANMGSTAEEHAGEVLGKPLADGIITRFLEGMGQLPSKMKESVRAALEAGRQEVEAQQGAFSTAFSNLGQIANMAFEKVLGAIKTPSEILLAKMQRQDAVAALKKSLADSNKAIADAHTNLAADVGKAQEALAKSMREYEDALTKVGEAQHKLEELQAGKLNKKGENTVTADQITSAQDALREAQQGVADKQLAMRDAYQANIDAQTKGNADLKAAQDAHAQAERAIQEDALQKKAEKERKHEDEILALRRLSFSNQLAALEKHLAKAGATQQKSHLEIMKLFKSFGIDYETSGAALGEAFARGLRNSVASVEGAAQAIARVIQRYIKVKSPTEAGPMSDLDSWWTRLPETLLSGIKPGAFQQALNDMLRLDRVGPSGLTLPSLGGGGVAAPNAVPMLGQILGELRTQTEHMREHGYQVVTIATGGAPVSANDIAMAAAR